LQVCLRNNCSQENADGNGNGDGDGNADDSPTVIPIGCGREGREPLVIRLPNINAEILEIAERFNQARQNGFSWNEMAIICRNYHLLDVCERILKQKKLPHQVRRKTGSFNPASDTIKILTMHVSKGLEFPVVAMPGVGQLPMQGEDEDAEAQLFYVACTRATAELILTCSADSKFTRLLSQVPS